MTFEPLNSMQEVSQLPVSSVIIAWYVELVWSFSIKGVRGSYTIFNQHNQM